MCCIAGIIDDIWSTLKMCIKICKKQYIYICMYVCMFVCTYTHSIGIIASRV